MLRTGIIGEARSNSVLYLGLRRPARANEAFGQHENLRQQVRQIAVTSFAASNCWFIAREDSTLAYRLLSRCFNKLTHLWRSRMSLAQNAQAAAHEELPKDVAELADAIAHLPAELRVKLEPLMSRVVDSTKRRRRILSLVQDALGQLRLDMKYLVFDLEATRRERDALKFQSDDEVPPLDDQI